jgi:hypothetical protein
MNPTDLLSPSVLVPVAVVLVLVLGVGIAVVKVVLGKKAGRNLEQWSQGAYSIWTGGEDCGTWAQERAQKSLASWYGATGPGKFWEVIADLRQGTTGNPAWDRVRALDLLRIGFAAKLIDADQCWTEAAKIGAELQGRYRSWEELAQAFEAGMQAWQRSRGVTDPNELGRVQRTRPALRGQIWPRARYDAQLAADD